MKMNQQDKFQHAAVVDQRRDTVMREVDLVKDYTVSLSAA